ncbi:hypothetical protein Hdeb2414_s0008g00277151 [Helianthus debilis subsp. tardiflorus]
MAIKGVFQGAIPLLNPHSLTTTGSRIASYRLHSRIKLRVLVER